MVLANGIYHKLKEQLKNGGALLLDLLFLAYLGIEGEHTSYIICAIAYLQLQANVPSKMAKKAYISCEQATHILWQTIQCTIYNKAIGNVDFRIKLKRFCSALPCFWQSICEHDVLFSIHAYKALNMHLKMTQYNRSTRRLVPLYERTLQGQAM